MVFTTKTQPGHGDLIIMSFNSSNVKKLFTKETGIDPDAGSLEELKYCSWWIKQINTDPVKLVDFLYEFTGINETHYYYLMGNAEELEWSSDVVRLTFYEYCLNCYLKRGSRQILKKENQLGRSYRNAGKIL